MSTEAFLAGLAKRRKQLKMPIEAIARRSGLGKATIKRMFSGKKVNLGPSLFKVASAMGIEHEVDSDGVLKLKVTPPEEFRKAQAHKQAKRLVGLTQGTMALEGQAVGNDFLKRLEEESAQRLLSGPQKRLWGY